MVERKADFTRNMMFCDCWGVHIFSYNLFHQTQVKCGCMIKSTEQCKSGFDLFNPMFCLNPYHYIPSEISSKILFLKSKFIIIECTERFLQLKFGLNLNKTD